MPKAGAKKRRHPATPAVGSDYQVFVSHATADKWIATVLCEKLEGVGAATFRDDRDIRGGDEIPEEIRKQIKRSKEFLVLLTPQSVHRQWVLLEVGMALAFKRRIVAVRYHVDIDPIPEMIKSKKTYSLNEVDNYFREVSDRLRKQAK